MTEKTRKAETDLLSRARFGLLARCFGVSAAAVIVVVGLMRDILGGLSASLGRNIEILAVTLAMTAAGQIVYNEKLLAPLKAGARSLLDTKKEPGELSPRIIGVIVGIWLAAAVLVYAVMTASLGYMLPLWEFALTVSVTGAIVGGAVYSVFRLDRNGVEPSPDTLVKTVLDIPLKSASFSLGMWILAGLLLGSGFRFLGGIRTLWAVDFLLMAIMAGILAFPMQYYLFKRVMTPIRDELIRAGYRNYPGGTRFFIKYKTSVAIGASALFAVGFYGLINYNTFSRLLTTQVEGQLKRNLRGLSEKSGDLSMDKLRKRLVDIGKTCRAVPFMADENGFMDYLPVPDEYSGLAAAAAKGDGSFLKRLPDVVVMESVGAGSVRLGLIYPRENLSPMLGEVRNQAFAFGMLALLLAGALAYFLSKDVTTPLAMMRDEAAKFIEGDYDWQSRFLADDESADLAIGFESMSGELTAKIREVKNLIENIELGVQRLGSSAGELESAFREQAAGSAEQAAAIQEALTTAGEIAATAKQISENALTVDNVASESRSACKSSSEVVSITIGGVKEVMEHVNTVAKGTAELAQLSQRIGGVVDIIREINEQTHVLSVNASIEASGAGEEGKRFGVLAREIRRMAEGTGEATEQINSLVELVRKSTTSTVMMAEEAAKVVDSWVRQVESLGDAFANIDHLVEMASGATGDIKLSTRQQTTACEQMADVIAEVKDVADQMVSNAKHTEQSITDLTQLADKLRALVEERRIEEGRA